MRLLKESFAYYKLHENENTERFRDVLLGHLMQVAELMNEKRVEDAHSLLVRMFTFSADFDLVNDRKMSLPFYRVWYFF